MERAWKGDDEGSSGKSDKTWLIVGVSVAGVMVVIVTAFLVYLCIRKWRKKATDFSKSSSTKTFPPEPLLVATTKVTNVKGNMGVIRSASKGEDYFKQLARTTKVRSISDYK